MSIWRAIFDTFMPYVHVVKMTWTEHDDTHTAKVGHYELKVRESKQFKSHGWVITRGYIVKAGDTGSLDDAKKAAEAAVKKLNKG